MYFLAYKQKGLYWEGGRWRRRRLITGDRAY